MIPKKIHYCWFGKTPKNELVKRCIHGWTKVLPDYQIHEWNESNSPMESPYMRIAYRNQLWSKSSNLVRLYAVYVEGGIYLDTDVQVVKSLTPLLDNPCFLGFQQEHEGSDWVNVAVIGAVKGHPFIQALAYCVVESLLRMRQFSCIPETTTRLLRKAGLKEYGMQVINDVMLYPLEYFYPYPWNGQFSSECITSNTHCVHHWQASWVSTKSTKLDISESDLDQVRNWLYGKHQWIRANNWASTFDRTHPIGKLQIVGD